MDSASQVVAGMLSNDVVLIDEIDRSVKEEHFVDPTLRSLFRSAIYYRRQADGVLPSAAIDALTGDLDAGTAALFRETYESLRDAGVTSDIARFAAHTLRREHEKRLTQIALRESSDILVGSITEEGPNGRPGRTWSGPADAREWAAARIQEINTESQLEEAPAADVMQEGRDVLTDYVRARDEDTSGRPLFGLPTLDEKIGGLGKGLAMIAAPSGFGKSQLCVGLSYHASQLQGRSVFFATSETVRSMVRSRLVARHSLHEKFADFRDEFNLPKGLDSALIDRGKLPETVMPYLVAVAKDWGADGSINSDGACYVSQMPYGMTMLSLKAQIEAYSRIRVPDLVVIDYLALMSSGRHTLSSREELATLVKEAAHFSVDFRKGRGVATVSPWQLNRESQKEWTRTGDLDPNGLADTSEAVNSAYIVIAMSPDGERESQTARIKMNILKHRGGEVVMGDRAIPVLVDYSTSYFTEAVGAPGVTGADPFAAEGGNFGADQAYLLGAGAQF
ncbi:MAG: DnaB-like helicase C-terminal domain-containing protein [Candidatus Nanopelagicales bacterium]